MFTLVIHPRRALFRFSRLTSVKTASTAIETEIFWNQLQTFKISLCLQSRRGEFTLRNPKSTETALEGNYTWKLPFHAQNRNQIRDEQFPARTWRFERWKKTRKVSTAVNALNSEMCAGCGCWCWYSPQEPWSPEDGERMWTMMMILFSYNEAERNFYFCGAQVFTHSSPLAPTHWRYESLQQ